ncbi:hypothetical protein ACU4HD_35925 [Cupriavidus basilensis]
MKIAIFRYLSHGEIRAKEVRHRPGCLWLPRKQMKVGIPGLGSRLTPFTPMPLRTNIS